MALYSDPYCIIETEDIVSASLCDNHSPHGCFYAISSIQVLGHQSRRTLVEYPDKQTRDRAFIDLRMRMGVYELDAEEEGL
jgi:hypothetical protein